MEVIHNKKWLDVNDPKLMEKNLRFAESVARAGGDIDRLEEFDLAAAAFPNPTPIVAATCVCGAGHTPYAVSPPPPPLPQWRTPQPFPGEARRLGRRTHAHARALWAAAVARPAFACRDREGGNALVGPRPCDGVQAA